MSRSSHDDRQNSGHGNAGLEFEWHSAKAASNLKKHKVSFEEASSIFKDWMHIEAPDRWHSDEEQRYLGIGRSVKDRILTIYFTLRSERIRIISARLAERWERIEYEAKDEQGRS